MTIAAEPYLKENIDAHIMINPWREKDSIPVFLRNIYVFYEMTILNAPCVLVEIIDEMPGIDVLQKHIKRIHEFTNQQIVLYCKEITRYRRKSLIENRIPFFVEDGQMFLPFLGLNLKKVPQSVKKDVHTFSPSTQKVYLYFLYNKDNVVNTTELAEKLDLTVMTASRTLNDLYYAKLLRYEIGGKTGRSKEYRRIADPEYFKVGKTFMKSPVKKVVYVRRPPEGALIAGLEALAGLSMINPPNHLVRAISQQQLDKEDFEIVNNRDIVKDEKLVELQIWDYDPKEFANKNHVDYMSLYASLKEENDERIEQALEEILRGEKWYTG